MTHLAEALEPRTLLSRTDLDPTWGNSQYDDGVFTLGPSENLSGMQLAPSPGGKLLLTGLASKNVNDVFGYDFIRVGINADGTVDTTESHDVGVPLDDILSAITQPDGKTLFVGSTGSGSDMAVLRVNGDGSVDTAFGTDGVASVFKQSNDSGIVEQAWAVALQPDGKILIAGNRDNVRAPSPDSPDVRNAQVVRFTADGHLDPTFHGDGTFTLDSGFSELHGIALLGDGKILACGIGTPRKGVLDGMLLRFNPDGSLDTSFDGDGMLFVPDTRQLGQARKLPDGKWIVGATGLVRLNADGMPDTTFGAGGVVKAPMPDVVFDSPVVDSAGRIVSTWADNNGHNGLTRYLPDGTPDTTFAEGGFLERDFISGPPAFQGDDDHIVVSGTYSLEAFAPVQSVLLSPHGNLYVNATPQDDDVLVDRTPGNDRLLVNGTETLFAKDAVKGTNIYLDTGDDAARVLIDVPCTITGGNGNDLIETGSGDDSIAGGHGNDTIRSGDGADDIDAGDGNNRIFCGDNPGIPTSYIKAGDGDDVISTGDGGGRWVSAGGGNNRVTLGNVSNYCSLGSGDGNDSWTIASIGYGIFDLFSGGGDDTITSGGGSNIILTGDSDDFGNPTYTPRADSIDAGAGNDVVHGGAGRQIIYGEDGNDSLYGDAGSDHLVGGSGSDLLSAGGGRDYLIGGLGADRLYGGNGKDRINGNGGRDRIFGGADDDELFGDGGNDTLDGGGGADFLHGGAGDDSFFCSGDDAPDTLFAAAGRDTAAADAGVDILHGAEVLA
jgi:uncharacterized delta-60 repeat protein